MKGKLEHPNRFPFLEVERATLRMASELRSRWPKFLKEFVVNFELMRPTAMAGFPLSQEEGLLFEHLSAGMLNPSAQTMVEKTLPTIYATGAALAHDPLSRDGNYKTPSKSAVKERKQTLADDVAFHFVQQQTFNSIKTKDSAQLGSFRGMLLETLQAGQSPREAAKRAHTEIGQDAASWVRIARTESARALNAGMFSEARRLGKQYVYIPQQPSACQSCHRLLIGRVFPADVLASGSNQGRKPADRVACVPLHPNCTCLPVPASSWVEEAALEASGGSIPPEGVKINYVPPNER